MVSRQYTAPELGDLAGPIVTLAIRQGLFRRRVPCHAPSRVPVDESGGEHWSRARSSIMLSAGSKLVTNNGGHARSQELY